MSTSWPHAAAEARTASGLLAAEQRDRALDGVARPGDAPLERWPSRRAGLGRTAQGVEGDVVEALAERAQLADDRGELALAHASARAPGRSGAGRSLDPVR